MISPTGSVPRQVGIFAHLVSTVASGDASLAQVACVALLPGFWIHGFAAHSKGRVFAALATVAIVATLTQVTASLPVRFQMPLFYRGIFAPGLCNCNCNYKTLPDVKRRVEKVSVSSHLLLWPSATPPPPLNRKLKYETSFCYFMAEPLKQISHLKNARRYNENNVKIAIFNLKGTGENKVQTYCKKSQNSKNCLYC